LQNSVDNCYYGRAFMEGIQEPADAQPDIEEELTEQCTLARMR